MQSSTVKLEIDARGVATVTLNRAEKHNALNPELIDTLHATIDKLASAPDVRAVVLTGAGKSFCAGGDLKWMEAQGAATRSERIQEARRLASMLGAMNTLPKPVIAKVNGNAMGGGFGILCVCDHVVVSDTAAVGLTETRLGLIPATIGPYVLARLGIGTARQVFMSGEIMRGQAVVDLGLAQSAVPAAALDDAVDGIVAHYLNVSPGAVAMAKTLLHDLSTGLEPEKVDVSIHALADCWESDHARDGIRSFFAQEKAPWQA